MQNFKICFFLLSTFLLPAFVYTQSSDNVEKNQIINTRIAPISGKIKNYYAKDDNKFITIRTFTIDGRFKDTSIYINKAGAFRINLLQEFEGDFALMYE